MYAIYEQRADQLDLFDDAEGEILDINEAEELMRQLRVENPTEFERIASLRDGIRSAMQSSLKSYFVFCEAGRYQQLYLVDANGKIESCDPMKVLSAIRCSPEAPAQPLSKGHNNEIMRVKAKFDEEVKHRLAQRDHSADWSRGQRYVIRELRIEFERAKDDDKRGQLGILERVFRSSLSPAVKNELNLLRRNGVIGDALIENLTRVYHNYNLSVSSDKSDPETETNELPRIVCSEGLV